MPARLNVRKWLERESTPGLVLIAATFLSFILMNGPGADTFQHFLEAPLGTLTGHADGAAHPVTMHLIINDALMVIFFLYVGLELKRETVEGPLKNLRASALPLAGALGGMIAPAAIYYAINCGHPEYLRGWAIPAATDIAFALGFMSLSGPRVPGGLRLFLLALSIIDDLGAIVFIALFYSSHLIGWALAGAAATFLLMMMMNRSGVTNLAFYWLLGLVLWGFILVSGVNATIAGVLTAVTVPMRDRNGASPLIASERSLKHWVLFAIMPVFALANAGAVLHATNAAASLHPIALGIGAGLVLGKPLGITLATVIASKALHQAMPGTLPQMLALGVLAGTGFTMSLFIAALAFGQGDLAAPARLGVLGGSTVSVLAGLALLWWSCRPASQHART